jgi:SAM-dependent methyltransferase
METLSICPSCLNSTIASAFTTEDYYTRSEGIFSVWTCETCRCYFLNPRPSSAELAHYYPTDYYSFQGSSGGSRRLSQRILRNLKPFRAWNAVWERVNKGNTWSRTAPRNAQGALLDVGCGGGAFLSFLRERNPALRLVGCDPFGPADAPSLKARGIEYRCTAVEECGFKEREFDVVTMNHVFEHHPAPAALLDELFRILKPGGALYVGVPNTDGAGRRLFGRFWFGWDAPRHLVDFGMGSLSGLLARGGFRVMIVRHKSNAGHLLASVSYRVFGKTPAPSWWNRDLTQDALFAVVNPIAGLTNLLSVGDNIEVACLRP